MTHRTPHLLAAAVSVVVLAAPSTASAWTGGGGVGILTITADLGEANRVDVDVAPNGRLEVSDGAGAPRVLGPGCEDPDQEGVASCDRAGIARVVIETGNLDDAVTVGEIGVPVEVRLGEGNDSVSTGSGDDTVDGDLGDDVIVGGDQLDGGAGADRIDGGTGDDQIAGGDGDDRISAGEG
ncbi:calcium-binding protein, partial [Patulibacter sp. S7RM1-6]